ncbi:MAG: ABC transporter permease [Lachnospiraceae bacterium]|nr:ABC transporter permease [Lachnospiraceae bacterium]
MRLRNLLIWDIKFQARYGFYFLYGFLTALYVILLLSFPISWKANAAAILIFSDPAAMGLFFMGAIVLLEKSQRVTSFMSITPTKALEYILSKVISLSLTGMLVAGVLGIAAGGKNIPLLMLGTLLSSVIFTLFGVIIATKTTTLNRFILATVPVEIITFVPGLLHLFGITPPQGSLYPPNACMDLVAGKGFPIPGILLAIGLIAALMYIAHRSVLKMWQSQGGVKI